MRRRKEGHVLLNDAFNTFYVRLYDVGHIVRDSERESPLPHVLLFPISTGYFICNIIQIG